MGKFVRVAEFDELIEGRPLAVEVGRASVALFRLGERACALADLCSHSGGPLSEGEVRGGQVVCPWHGALFDIATGRSAGPPAGADQRVFATRLRDGAVEVEEPG